MLKPIFQALFARVYVKYQYYFWLKGGHGIIEVDYDEIVNCNLGLDCDLEVPVKLGVSRRI